MPRIIVVPENIDQSPTAIVLDERVDVAELCEDDGAGSLIERLGWALSDAADAERAA